jgi:hypothetical protein
MFLLSALPALAGLRAELDTEARDGADVSVVCAAADEAFGKLDEAMRQLPDTPVPAGLTSFLQGFTTLPLPGRPLAISFWQQSRTLQISFDTALTAEALSYRLAAIDPDAGGVPFQDQAGWGVREEDGEELRVLVSDGRARVVHGAAATRQTRTLPPALLATLPDSGGCAIAAHKLDDDMGMLDMVVHLPLQKAAPVAFGFTAPALRDSDAILLSGAVPPDVRTPEAPAALLALGIGLDSIDFSTFLEGKELRQARQLQRFFPVTGGTTVAVLSLSPPRLAAVMPLARPLPPKVISQRLQRLAKKAELPFERRDATNLTLRMDDLELLTSAAKGRLYLSTDPGTLNAVQQGTGTPWMEGTLGALAAEWPLLIATNELPTLPGLEGRTLDRPLFIALDLDDGVVRGLLDVPLTLEELGGLAQAMREVIPASSAGD